MRHLFLVIAAIAVVLSGGACGQILGIPSDYELCGPDGAGGCGGGGSGGAGGSGGDAGPDATK